MSPKLPLIKKSQNSNIDFRATSNKLSGWLMFGYSLFIAGFLVVLSLRLFQLTVVKGEYYQRLADENRIREVVIEPKRGTIKDRKGLILAFNTDAEEKSIGERFVSRRFYDEPEALSHLLGYRQIGDKQDMENDLCTNKMKLGDKVGKKSVEKIFECELRGRSGKKLIEVNAPGKLLKTLTVIPPKDGQMIQLGVDLGLQKKAYELIKGQRAVVVGLKPKTGEVLILASSPSFNVQAFENSETTKVSAYFSDKEKPLFDRATEGTYPPGSIFKLIIAAGGLEEKKITQSTIIEDTGQIKAGQATFGNWYFLQYGKTEGAVDIIKAIRRSNDIFFYRAGQMMGPTLIKKWSEQFGLGKETGIGLSEAEGTIPSPFWKEETFKEQWYLGDTYNLSIGQGYVLTTPLQMALATAVFANDGYLCRPQLLKKEGSDKSGCKKMALSKTTLETVKQGMEEACKAGGTGWPFFQFGVSRSQPSDSEGQSESVKSAKTDSTGSTDSNGFQPILVACKTGTAESHGETTKPHAWFTVYAPAKDPEIVLTVLVEEAGQGSDVAAPITKDILKMYFERN